VPSVDPSAGISERPSPVSVLDSSFDHEDLFPSSRNPNSLAVGMIIFSKLLFVNYSNWKLKYVFLFHFNVSMYLLSILVSHCTIEAAFELKVYTDYTVNYCVQVYVKIRQWRCFLTKG
jgi:hypothetical protein